MFLKYAKINLKDLAQEGFDETILLRKRNLCEKLLFRFLMKIQLFPLKKP